MGWVEDFASKSDVVHYTIEGSGGFDRQRLGGCRISNIGLGSSRGLFGLDGPRCV